MNYLSANSRPLVTYTLIGLCALVFFAVEASGLPQAELLALYLPALMLLLGRSWIAALKFLMQIQELETYLYQHIPLTQAMQVSVLSIEPEQLILQAPLKPNMNPHHTVFGGSVATLATLAAWCLLYTRLELEGIANHLVIRRSTLDYEQPIAGDFKAIASLEAPEQWARQRYNYSSSGVGRNGLCFAF